MSIQEIGAIGELIAAVAVVISLLYLARQVRQANALARGQTRERMVEQGQTELYKGFIDEPSIVRSLYQSEPLSEVEWIRVTGWLFSAMRQREYEWFQKRDGNIDKNLWYAYREVIPIQLSSPRLREWWEMIGSEPFDPEFRAMVSQLLQERDGSGFFREFQKLVTKDQARLPANA